MGFILVVGLSGTKSVFFQIHCETTLKQWLFDVNKYLTKSIDNQTGIV
jgi:hypothetical protein